MTNSPVTGEFIPPPPGSEGVADVGALLRNTIYQIDTDPAAQNQPQIIDLARLTGDKKYAGCSYIRTPLNDNRSGHSQTGKYSAVNTKRAGGALIVDDPGYLRLPFLTTALAMNPPGNIDRICKADIFGTTVFTGFEAGTAHLWRETSPTDPTPIAVAGFVPPLGNSGITAIRKVMINGIPYLAICYAVAAANSVQILSDLANPPTSSTIPVGIFPTYDLIQTAIDGNAIVFMKGDALGNCILAAMRTDVGVGSVALSGARSTLTPGGYAVGASGWEGEPYLYWVEPIEGNSIIYGGGGVSVVNSTNRGRLLRTDLRGYLASPVDVPLPWVTFATRVRGGIVVCDTNTHWNLGKKGYQHELRRMPLFDDLPANSNGGQQCCGHHELAGRFMCEINDFGYTATITHTQRYWMEWDFDMWAPQQVSSAKQLSTVGLLSPGGADRPWSPLTRFLHSRADGSWYRQYEPGLGVNGFNERHTSGSTPGTGHQYELTETLTWPVMDIEGQEDRAKMPIAAIGPKAGNVTQGGPAATVLLEELLSGATGSPAASPQGRGALFGTTEPTERRPRQALKGGWTYQIQPKVTLTRDNAVTDASLMTPNGFGNDIFMEFLSIKNPLMAPTMELLKQYLDPIREKGR